MSEHITDGIVLEATLKLNKCDCETCCHDVENDLKKIIPILEKHGWIHKSEVIRELEYVEMYIRDDHDKAYINGYIGGLKDE